MTKARVGLHDRRGLLFACVAVGALAGGLVAALGPSTTSSDHRANDGSALVASTTRGASLTPAPTPTVGPFPKTRQISYVPGPFISQAAAVSIADRVAGRSGQGGGVVGATLESVANATSDEGSRVVAATVATTRMVWLVWIVGTFQPDCLTSTCPVWHDELYNVVLDAKTGRVLGVATTKTMPGAPSVPAGTHLGNQTG